MIFFNSNMCPGKMLKKHLKQQNMTIGQLSKKTSIKKFTIYNIIYNNKTITTNIANKLEYAFDLPSTYWLDLQKKYNNRS